ncbi:MAG: hypothetical protein WC489_01550, partial [Patescibacteria group bacterium]
MTKTNKIILVLFILLLVLITGELAHYFIFVRSADIQKQGFSSAKNNSCLLSSEEQAKCKNHRNLIKEIGNIERDLEQNVLDSVTMSYTYTFFVKKISMPCKRNYGGYPVEPDICIESVPPEQAEGVKTAETIYKFVGTPKIDFFEDRDGKETKITADKIKTGDKI